MKNELVVKQVEFNGNTIAAAQDKETGKIYVGVKWICDGIGLSEGQTKNERLKIQEDIVLKQGGRNFVLNKCSVNREVLCIELDFLPLWLAKISITPTMQKEQPEVTENLINYQLKAKDVLADAFIKKSKDKSKSERIQIMEMNARTRMANTYLKLANVDTLSKEYKNILVSKATEILSGEQLIPLPKSKDSKKTYSATEIGEIFGITANKIGRLANANNLKTEEYGEYYRSKSEYSAKEVDTWVYYDAAISAFARILGVDVA